MTKRERTLREIVLTTIRNMDQDRFVDPVIKAALKFEPPKGREDAIIDFLIDDLNKRLAAWGKAA